MKLSAFFLFCLLIGTGSFAQSKKEQIEALQADTAALRNDYRELLETYQFMADSMQLQLQELNRDSRMLTYENKELRHIMKGYIRDIDSLQTELQRCYDDLGDAERELGYVDPEAHNGFGSPSPTVESKQTSNSITSTNANSSSETSAYNNPFGDGSSIGDDRGQQGDGPGVQGDGIGYSSASCGPSQRILLTHVNANDIQFNHDAKLVFNLMVDENGNVIDVRNVPALSTTTDAVLIHKVVQLVKQQVRYSKSPGARPTMLRYTVNLKAT